jgi:Ca2+-binding EF-hand superfamily protein
MKHKIKIALATLALGVSALAASAQEDGGRPPPGGGQGGPDMGHRPPPPLILKALDANHDGVIDADEIANSPAALKALDINGDGQLTPNEYLGGNAPTNAPTSTGKHAHKHPVPPLVTALDANHDGVIDSNEIANASAALKTLDKNGDGKLTRDEYMGPRPQMHGGPNGGQGGDHPDGPPPGEADSSNSTPPSGPPPGDN